MAAKIAVFATKGIIFKKVAYLMRFDLLRTKICIISTFEEQLPVKKRLESKKFKMATKTGSDAKVETDSFIIFHLISLI